VFYAFGVFRFIATRSRAARTQFSPDLPKAVSDTPLKPTVLASLTL